MMEQGHNVTHVSTYCQGKVLHVKSSNCDHDLKKGASKSKGITYTSFMLPNSLDFVESLPIQERIPDHPNWHFKNPDLTKIRYKSKGCVNLAHNLL